VCVKVSTGFSVIDVGTYFEPTANKVWQLAKTLFDSFELFYVFNHKRNGQATLASRKLNFYIMLSHYCQADYCW